MTNEEMLSQTEDVRNDSISRKATLLALLKWFNPDGKEMDVELARILMEVCLVIDQMPSSPHWIPCGERLPDSNGYVLVTDFGETDIGRRYDGKWVDCYGDKMKDVAAWMPLPQPYQGERREE